MFHFGVTWKRRNALFLCVSKCLSIIEVTFTCTWDAKQAKGVILIHCSSLWSVLALSWYQWLQSVDVKSGTRNSSTFSFSGISVFSRAIICSFLYFPVFKTLLSFLWGGLVQSKGFSPPTSVHCSQKGHLIIAVGQLVLRTVQAGKGLFPLLRATCIAKRSCKLYRFPCFLNIRFSRVCPLSLFSSLLPSLVTMENEMPVPFKLSAE